MNGTERQECYHYDCSKDATRIHHDKLRCSNPAPCCDEHEPMHATKMWTPIEQPQQTIGNYDTDTDRERQ